MFIADTPPALSAPASARAERAQIFGVMATGPQADLDRLEATTRGVGFPCQQMDGPDGHELAVVFPPHSDPAKVSAYLSDLQSGSFADISLRNHTVAVVRGVKRPVSDHLRLTWTAQKRTLAPMIEQRVYPPFHLDASPDDLEAFGRGLASFAPILNGYHPDEAGQRADMIWFKDIDGTEWSVGVGQRDLEFKFEVFNLGIQTAAALKTRIESALPMTLAEDAPAWLRAVVAAPRVAPTPPEKFKRLPFAIDRIDVLRRAEFIVTGVDVGPTFGDNPNSQSAALPMDVPSEADACCVVSVALLFSGHRGERLLIGTDWLPFNMIVTQNSKVIDHYASACEAFDFREYAGMLRAAGLTA